MQIACGQAPCSPGSDHAESLQAGETLAKNGALCHSISKWNFPNSFAFKSITQLPATATIESKAQFSCVQEAGLMWSTMWSTTEVRRWEETKAQLPPPPPASPQPVPPPGLCSPGHIYPPPTHPPDVQRYIGTSGQTLASALPPTCFPISLLPSPLSSNDLCTLIKSALTLSPPTCPPRRVPSASSACSASFILTLTESHSGNEGSLGSSPTQPRALESRGWQRASKLWYCLSGGVSLNVNRYLPHILGWNPSSGISCVMGELFRLSESRLLLLSPFGGVAQSTQRQWPVGAAILRGPLPTLSTYSNPSSLSPTSFPSLSYNTLYLILPSSIPDPQPFLAPSNRNRG